MDKTKKPDITDLEGLAQKLIKEGPYKYEFTPRRVRGLLGGKYVIDTTSALYVWEHPYYPQYFLPRSSVTPHAKLNSLSAISGTNDSVYLGKLESGDASTSRVLIFSSNAPAPFADTIKVDFATMDQWFEENTPIYVHPKDPYKRIDILPSSRHVCISLRGSANTILSETSHPVILFETGLRPRYYIAPTEVNWEVLKESPTVTYCPYKGQARYWDVVVDGKVEKDLVWAYQYPTIESAGIAGLMCFYNERVKVEVDGTVEE
ncbi:DUF427-domain-containing protein [Delitschia confertaspora ATCC 74209]|uniref:DUF427-domain-containing protein n=1 Tax=Delitschia confertaspora ATCC 74209 TaxID=1513339 RepID=A0A9P4JQ15_9PLEO|nr:DUF427-domain-containing protein [Delitschia confertaspora ATCC 74209]